MTKVFFSTLLIDLDDFDIKENIGYGSFGVVFRAINKKTNDEVALKSIQSSDKLKGKKELRNILSEASVPKILNLPGIIKLLGFRFPLTAEQKEKEELIQIQITDKVGKKRMADLTGAIYISELMKNGSLDSIVPNYLNTNGKSCEKMNPTIRSKILFGIAATMKYVHRKKVIHRDLKLENVFLDDKLEPRIADFGLSKVIYDQVDMTMLVGTPLYMAPELFIDTDEPYTVAVDVFAFAFIIYKMFTNDVIFSDKKPVRSHQQYMMKIAKKLRPIRPKSIPDDYWDLIQHCWEHDPNLRPTFEDITEELKNEKYAIEEFGMTTDLDQLHEYQMRIDQELISDLENGSGTPQRLMSSGRKITFNWGRH